MKAKEVLELAYTTSARIKKGDLAAELIILDAFQLILDKLETENLSAVKRTAEVMQMVLQIMIK